jgi:phosphatidylglycerophosphatase A
MRPLLATALGAGRVPWAPGTAGSLVGLALALGLERAGGPRAVALGAVLATAIGLAVAGPVARELGQSDPPAVVIDEVAGQLVALLFLPPSVRTLTLGFVLFRLLDVWKPPPLRQVERWPGSLGIMADDLLAGAGANLAQRGLAWGVAMLWGQA